MIKYTIVEDAGNSDEDEIGPKPPESTTLEPELLTRDDSWRKHTPLSREWDKGKEGK